MSAAKQDPRVQSDLELVYARMGGTPWASDLRDSCPVLAEDVASGAADRLAECLEVVESDLVALWIAEAFGTPEADAYAPFLLRKWSAVEGEVARFAIGNALFGMASPRIEAHAEDVAELLRTPGYDAGRRGLAHALPRLGARGVDAAIDLLGTHPRLDADLLYGLKEAPEIVSPDVLARWENDPRATVRRLAGQLRRRRP